MFYEVPPFTRCRHCCRPRCGAASFEVPPTVCARSISAVVVLGWRGSTGSSYSAARRRRPDAAVTFVSRSVGHFSGWSVSSSKQFVVKWHFAKLPGLVMFVWLLCHWATGFYLTSHSEVFSKHMFIITYLNS